MGDDGCRSRMRRAAATAGMAVGLTVAATACTANTPQAAPTAPTASAAPTTASTARGGGTATTSAGGSTAGGTTVAAGGQGAAAAGSCSLNTFATLVGESSSADEAQTASWVPLRANGWTVFAPGGDWHLSASDAGADVLSPDGGSDASLATWYAQTPWTMNGLAQRILTGVSNIHVICTTPQEQGADGTTQATELTGVYQGESIHAIIAVSLMTPTTSGLFVGETRSIYAPASQWSSSAEQTLTMVLKRAIPSPQAP